MGKSKEFDMRDGMGRVFGLTWVGLGQVHGVQWSHEFDLVACGF